jgi:hypothetical protein
LALDINVKCRRFSSTHKNVVVTRKNNPAFRYSPVI